MHIVLVLIWAFFHFLEVEDTLNVFTKRTEKNSIILQIQVSKRCFENNILADLSIEWNVLDSGFFDNLRLIIILFDFEAAQVVVEQDVLLPQPMHNFFMRFAGSWVSLERTLFLVTFFELKDYIFGHCGVKVAMDGNIWVSKAFKLAVIVLEVVE